MSHQASAYVKGLLRDQVTRPQKLLLMVLADYHNTETQLSYPSLERLALESLVDERAARRILNELEGRIIERVPGQGRGNHTAYRFIAIDKEIGGYVTPFLRAGKEGRKEGRKEGQKEGRKGDFFGSAIRKEPELEPEQNLPLVADDDCPEPPDGKAGQTQHALIRERIQELYNRANPETPCPWDERTGKILKDTLDRLRWSDAALLTAVENRFASEAAVLSEDPLRWISQLDRYRAGPLDRFNRSAIGGRKHVDATTDSRDREQRELQIGHEYEKRKRTGSDN